MSHHLQWFGTALFRCSRTCNQASPRMRLPDAATGQRTDAICSSPVRSVRASCKALLLRACLLNSSTAASTSAASALDTVLYTASAVWCRPLNRIFVICRTCMTRSDQRTAILAPWKSEQPSRQEADGTGFGAATLDCRIGAWLHWRADAYPLAPYSPKRPAVTTLTHQNSVRMP